jgi:hypothetical protein
MIDGNIIRTSVDGEHVELEHAVHAGGGLHVKCQHARGRVQQERDVAHGGQTWVCLHAVAVYAVRDRVVQRMGSLPNSVIHCFFKIYVLFEKVFEA